MSIFKKTIALSTSIALVAGVALAGGHSASPESKAISARQAKMTLYSFNLGILGAMAKGEAEFNADAATLAAANLSSLTGVWMPSAWAPGTDNESVKGSNALPKMWEDSPAEVGAKAKALSDASATLASAAGTLDGLRGAIGPVGEACGGCHKVYRAKPK